MKSFLLLAALAASSLPAHAKPPQAPSMQVSVAGLDLNNPADAAVMVQRIETAVRPICLAPGLAMRTTTAGCIRIITREAVKSLRIPQLKLALQQRATPSGPASRG